MTTKQGGKREGAGRKPSKEKKVPLSVRVSPEVKEWLTTQEKSAGELLDTFFKLIK